MSKIALYRKYRPHNFDQLYGQQIVAQTLESAIKNNEISHAYIFAGNKGSGKTTIAKIFSKAINCLNLKNHYNPCNECANCLAINQNATTDFIELDAASNNGINEIRTIIESVKYLPSQLKYKIYIIDEAHMLTVNSWNALLKTIEEPPEYVIFIFATTEYHKIPATIISRCQRYDFNKIASSDLKSLITDIAKKENIDISKQAIEMIIKMSDGSARDSLSLLDQLLNFNNKKITEKTICELFSILDIDTKIDLLNTIYDMNQDKCLDVIEQYYNKGINFENLVNDLLEILMDQLLYLRTHNEKLLNVLDKAKVELLKFNDQKQLLNVIEILMQCSKDIKQSINPKFSFNYHLIRIFQILNPNQVTTTNKQSIINHSLNKTTAEVKEEINNANHDPVNKITLFKTKDITDKYITNTNHQNNQEVVNTSNVNKWQQLSENKNTSDKKTSTKNKVENKNNDPIESKLSFNDYNEEFKNNFFAIACNNNKDLLTEFNNIYHNIKEFSSMYDHPINVLLDANKFLLVSNNGAVLLFDQKVQAMRFNELIDNKEIKTFIKTKFKDEKIVLGVDKNQVLAYKEEFKKINKKDFKDVKIIKNNDITKTKLLEILNGDEKE